MANYTETLGEYLEDHTLPEVFSEIDDFDKYFKARFIDREIGFETPLLFNVKLEGMALRVIPLYAARIEELELAKTALATPNYKVTNTRSGYQEDGGKDTFKRGEQDTSSTDLPFNSSTAEPNRLSHADEVTDETTYGKKTTYHDVKDEQAFTGFNTSDNLARIQYLDGRIVDFIDMCLSEFESLFMQIYHPNY